MSSDGEQSNKRKSDEFHEEEETLPTPKIVKLSDCSFLECNETLIDFEAVEKKVNQETQTEEEYLTNLEKFFQNYHENYSAMETEEYKQMLQKFYLHNLRLATRCQKLKAAVEKNFSPTTRILREISKQVNPHQLAFISAQLINNGKPPKKRVWSPQLRSLVVGLYQISPAAFKFMSQILLLPEEEDVKQLIKHGLECDLLDEETKNKKTKDDGVLTMEAQAVLDEIAFENLMATLL